MLRIIIASAAFASLLSAVPALAAPASVRVEGIALTSSGTGRVLAATVEYGDLDLSTGQGAAALYGRIENASAAVCGKKPFSKRDVKRFEACRAKAAASAVAAVNAPLLAEAAAGK